jgi:hypothetical protein
VLDCGGSVVIRVRGRPTGDTIRSKAELPPGPFNVVMVGLERSAKVDDEGLANLEGLSQVTNIGLSGTAVTGKGIAKLGKLRVLSDLFLNDTGIGDEAVQSLKLCDGLHNLDLKNTKITPSGVQELRTALPRCEITEP